MNKEHEIYRQWVALMDDEEASDVGVQGSKNQICFFLTY
jgi:hypothetical protein